jgi:hypothetical protein
VSESIAIATRLWRWDSAPQNADLYAVPPAFSTFAGTNKIVSFVQETVVRIDWLNGLFDGAERILAPVPAPRATDQIPRVLPAHWPIPLLAAPLVTFNNNHAADRDRLKAAGDILETVLTYIEDERQRALTRYMELPLFARRVPVVPSVPVRAGQVAPAPRRTPKRKRVVKISGVGHI